MLKERTETADPDNQDQPRDLYENALRTAFAKDRQDSLDFDLTYLAPLAVLTKEPSVLSQSIASGLPPLSADVTTKRSLWAFAVTSQNAVRAIVQALENQPDLGTTLASVQKAGFRNINTAPGRKESDDQEPTGPFYNAEHLVDFLVSFDWPRPTQGTSPPELWFLAGETRMKTLAEKLTAHNRPFQEIVVYETGPRPGFGPELQQWLDQKDTATDLVDTQGRPETRQHLIWLVGFSPRGVDLTWSTLVDHLSIVSTTSPSGTRIQWAAIGQTTAKRINELLATLDSCHHKIESTIAVAKAPNPTALAEAIYSCSSSDSQISKDK
ncbi:hypothetical protein BGZ83_010389 [Gryganskiella cystojenkinii]|nr:hypothetical protein BGZ83_010389 [Gryganskiella cystojenkinii]